MNGYVLRILVHEVKRALRCLNEKDRFIWFMFLLIWMFTILSISHYATAMIDYDVNWRDEYIIPEDYDRNIPNKEKQPILNVDRYGVAHLETARTRIKYRGASPTELDARSDLRSLDLRRKTIKGLKAVDCNMRNGNFSGTTFIECDFTGSDMSHGTFAETTFIKCILNNVKIHTDEFFLKVRIVDSQAKEMHFNGTYIESSTFMRTDFTGSDFSQIKISDNYFIECALDDVAMNGSIISNTLFNTIWKTKNLNLSKSTISGCSFITTLFNGVNLSETIFANGSRGNFINQCVFVFSDFNELVLEDTVISDSYITYPWNSEVKFNKACNAIYQYHYMTITPYVNSFKYAIIPYFGLIAAPISVSAKAVHNMKIIFKYYHAKNRFKECVPPMVAEPFKTDCLNVHTIKSTNRSKFINLHGLSDDMEDILRELGGDVYMDKPTGISPIGLIDTIYSISSMAEKSKLESDEKKRLRDTITEKEIANNELQRKLDHAYGYMRGDRNSNNGEQS